MSKHFLKYPEVESNHWPLDFQSNALPTELSGFAVIMLFSNKGNNEQNKQFNFWTGLNSKIQLSQNFYDLSTTLEIPKKYSRKHSYQIAQLNPTFFLFRLKQWKFFVKPMLQNKTEKTLCFWNENLNEKQFKKLIKTYGFLPKIKNIKAGSLSNFSIQQKRLFKEKNFKLRKLLNCKKIKKNKPTQFLLIHPTQKDRLLTKEIQKRQFPLITTENVDNTTISDFPLFLNITKNEILFDIIIDKTPKIPKLINKPYKRKLFLKTQKLIKKKLIRRFWIKGQYTQIEQKIKTAKLRNKNAKKVIRQLFRKKKLQINKIETLQNNWFLNITKRIWFRKLAKKKQRINTYKNIKQLTNNNFVIKKKKITPYNSVIARYQKNGWKLKKIKQKRTPQQKFLFYYKKVHRINKFKQALLLNTIQNKKTKYKFRKNEAVRKWFLPHFYRTTNTKVGRIFLSNKIYKNIYNWKNKIKKLKKINKKSKFITKFNYPPIKTLWRVNKRWLRRTQRRLLKEARDAKQRRFAMWWRRPVDSFLKGYVKTNKYKKNFGKFKKFNKFKRSPKRQKNKRNFISV